MRVVAIKTRFDLVSLQSVRQLFDWARNPGEPSQLESQPQKHFHKNAYRLSAVDHFGNH